MIFLSSYFISFLMILIFTSIYIYIYWCKKRNNIFLIKSKIKKYTFPIIDILFWCYVFATFLSNFTINNLTKLNHISQSNYSIEFTSLAFCLLILYGPNILIYFGLTNKINSTYLQKFSIFYSIPVSLIMYISLYWMLDIQYSIGDINNIKNRSLYIIIVKFIEITLSLLISFAFLIKNKNTFFSKENSDILFNEQKRNKNILIYILIIICFWIMMFPHGLISAIFGNGNGNLKILSWYQLIVFSLLILTIFVVYFICSKLNNKNKYKYLLILSFSLVCQYFKLFTFTKIALWNIPLHICDIGTVFVFISLYFKWRAFRIFVYFINVFGATVALSIPLINDGFFQMSTIVFVYEHILLIVIPIISVLVGVIDRPKTKEIIKIIPIFTGYYLFSIILGSILHVYDNNVNFFYVINDTIANFLPFLKPLRNITFKIGLATFYPIYWLIIYIGIIGIMYLINFLYNFIYIFEDYRIHMRSILFEINKIEKNYKFNKKNKLTNSLLTIHRLNKTFDESKNLILDNIKFNLRKKEIVWIIGGNGSGKSTLFKALSCLNMPDLNSVIYSEKYHYILDNENYKKNIGFMVDNHKQYESFTGMEFLLYISSLNNIDVDKSKKIILYYSKLLEVDNSLNYPLKNYSHGMKQKISFISSIIHEPKILILDEPFTGLDFQSFLLLKKIINDYAKKGNCILYSSHLYDFDKNIADRVGILHNGKINDWIKMNSFNSKTRLMNKLIKYQIMGAKNE